MVDRKCTNCVHFQLLCHEDPCKNCMDYALWEPKKVMKPTIKEIEEYMASLNIPMEQRFNGTASYDVVSKPKHYMLFEDQGIEVRDVISKLVDKMIRAENYVPLESPLFESDYVQLMQYLMRFMDKNGVEDLKKARWYLDKMIESY
jgi:hypothetical protein